MQKPSATPSPSLRKTPMPPGPIRAHYTCYRCQVGWVASYAGPWQLLDPAFKRDQCPSCGAGAAILRGYEPSLPGTEPRQLVLEL
jgi:hypothetical protein